MVCYFSETWYISDIGITLQTSLFRVLCDCKVSSCGVLSHMQSASGVHTLMLQWRRVRVHSTGSQVQRVHSTGSQVHTESALSHAHSRPVRRGGSGGSVQSKCHQQEQESHLQLDS